ncbi:hypothetical protein STIAU_4656, partial [Stigmatella aurantiaca DW4/3-1]
WAHFIHQQGELLLQRGDDVVVPVRRGEEGAGTVVAPVRGFRQVHPDELVHAHPCREGPVFRAAQGHVIHIRAQPLVRLTGQGETRGVGHRAGEHGGQDDPPPPRLQAGQHPAAREGDVIQVRGQEEGGVHSRWGELRKRQERSAVASVVAGS